MRWARLVFALSAGLGPGWAQTFAILPFFDRTGHPGWAWMGESVSELLLDAFASEGLLVAPRGDREEVMRRLRLRPGVPLTQASVVKIGMGLDATHVIFGQIEAPEGQLRLTATMLDIKRLSAGLRTVVSGPREELSWLGAQLAWQLLKTIWTGAGLTLELYLERRPPVRVDALEAYVRGLLASADVERIRCFSQAARLSPGFMPPVFQLGWTYLARKQWQEAALWMSRVSPDSPRYREALFHLGVARYHLGDYEGAEQAFSAIKELVPLSEVLNNLGAAQSRAGREGALEVLEQALAGDPADPTYHFNLGLALLKRGDGARAAERFRAVLERDPLDGEARMLLRAAADPVAARRVAASALERIKVNFEESAYLQLKALLNPGAPQ